MDHAFMHCRRTVHHAQISQMMQWSSASHSDLYICQHDQWQVYRGATRKLHLLYQKLFSCITATYPQWCLKWHTSFFYSRYRIFLPFSTVWRSIHIIYSTVQIIFVFSGACTVTSLPTGKLFHSVMANIYSKDIKPWKYRWCRKATGIVFF